MFDMTKKYVNIKYYARNNNSWEELVIQMIFIQMIFIYDGLIIAWGNNNSIRENESRNTICYNGLDIELSASNWNIIEEFNIS